MSFCQATNSFWPVLHINMAWVLRSSTNILGTDFHPYQQQTSVARNRFRLILRESMVASWSMSGALVPAGHTQPGIHLMEAKEFTKSTSQMLYDGKKTFSNSNSTGIALILLLPSAIYCRNLIITFVYKAY